MQSHSYLMVFITEISFWIHIWVKRNNFSFSENILTIIYFINLYFTNEELIIDGSIREKDKKLNLVGYIRSSVLCVIGKRMGGDQINSTKINIYKSFPGEKFKTFLKARSQSLITSLLPLPASRYLSSFQNVQQVSHATSHRHLSSLFLLHH